MTDFNRWYADFVQEGGREGKGVDYIVAQAQTKAVQYREMGSAYDDFQPGNGTSYKLVLHDMIAPYVRLMVERNPEDPAREGDEDFLLRLAYYIHEVGETEETLWRYAYPHTMAGRAGGELLVSMPENGGRCCVLSVTQGALFTPDYIAQVLGCRLGDAVPLAVYLTAFVQAVVESRSERSGVADAAV